MLVAIRWVFIADIALKFVLACNLTSHSTCQVCSHTNSKIFSKLHVGFWLDYWRSPQFPHRTRHCFSVVLGGAKRFVSDHRFDISAGASQHLGGQVADGALGC